MTREILLNDDLFLHRVARMLVKEGRGVPQIHSALLAAYPDLKSQTIYRAVGVLGKRNIISYNPKREIDLEEALHKTFEIPRSSVHVVKFAHDVPSEAARIARDILVREWSNRGRSPKAPIGLGLGPGLTTAEMTSELGRLLETSSPVRLRLFALAGGAPPDEPEVSPISFFSAIPDAIVEGRVGLFAPNLIWNSEFEKMMQSPGVKEAMAMKDEIFLCVTSMGDASDERDLLNRFLGAQSGEALRGITSKGYVGNIQYRPYSGDGPILESDDDYRAITLFEIADLVQRSRERDKHTILMARSKSEASMVPLLRNRDLRIFTELVTDSETAIGACNNK